MKEKPYYGNWVPWKLVCLLWTLAALSAVLLILSLVLWRQLILTVIFAVLAGCLLLYSVYMQRLHREFSFTGGGLMGKIHGFLLEKLPWEGKGTLVDIGCGSAALTIRCAKKYPEASFVGVDYWGAGWDYAKAQCEENARLEGVSTIEFIKGDARALPFEDGQFDAAVSNFVFHEVRTARDKRALIREALRVVKKGGSFAFHDLFENKRIYGDMNELVEELRQEGITEIHYEPNTENLPFIPAYIRTPLMLMNLGLLYGRK